MRISRLAVQRLRRHLLPNPAASGSPTRHSQLDRRDTVRRRSLLVVGTLTLLVPGCVSGDRPPEGSGPSWCDGYPRPLYSTLERRLPDVEWFEVYEVRAGVFAIYEPHQFEEVISYLVVGNARALLFDTGMGIASIRAVVSQVTDRPVFVLNSHTHPDHVGGNAEFDEVWGYPTPFSVQNAKGFSNDELAEIVRAEALCQPLPQGMDSATYAIPGFAFSTSVRDGQVIDLGGRTVEVLHVPGHTPDALALRDLDNGLLFTGDTFYEGPLYLFSPEADFAAYRTSVERLARLVPEIQLVLPGHNAAVAHPHQLLRLDSAVAAVQSGKATGRQRDGLVVYEFGSFSILLSDG